MLVAKCLLRLNIGHISWLTLSFGILFGFSFTCILLGTCQSYYGKVFLQPFWQAYSCDPQHPDDRSLGFHNQNEEFYKAGEYMVARKPPQKVRVLCWIMTSPMNHVTKARHVKATWGRRCDILLFMSSSNDTCLPTVKLCVGEGRRNLWAKTKEAFRYVYKHFLNDADWFMKADDDTYVIMENLRYMLSSYKPSEPIYFGSRLKNYVKQGFMSGGAGYVLSREALRRLVEDGLPDKNKCRPDHGGPEDVEIGKCLEAVGVEAGDSRDSLGRGRFLPADPEFHLTRIQSWYWMLIFHKSKKGFGCCSDSAISFHYIRPNQMYMLEYLIYHLRPYGISHYWEEPWSEEPAIEKVLLGKHKLTNGTNTR